MGAAAQGPVVVVVGVGLMTPVGLTAPESAASVRARTARFAEVDLRDKRFERFALAEVPDDGLPGSGDGAAGGPGLSAREHRLLRLAAQPLRECVAKLDPSRLPLGLCLALPERDTGRALNAAAFLQRLAAQVRGVFEPSASDASHRGRAGGLIAVGQAVATVAAGRAGLMLAGGVDTYRDVYVLGVLDAEERIKSAANWDGFIPGEAAAFVLVASDRAATALGLPPLARVSPVAVGFEPGHLYSRDPYRGDGLASTLTQLFSAQRGVRVEEVYSTMNGESHWAKEWGVSHIRNQDAFSPAHRVHHPADCYGDVGAASGPAMAALAALGIRGGYARSPALVYGSNDTGLRAALLVTNT